MTRTSDDHISDQPWWWVEAPPRSLPQVDIRPGCDVAIVGAGYTGLTAAITLAKAGKSVQIFEKERPGEGASSRNGGIISGGLRFGLGAAIKAFGAIRGVGLHREAIEARLHLKQLIDENGIECDHMLTGVFTGSLTQKDFDKQRREIKTFNQTFGTNHEIIEKADVSRFVSHDGYVGGTWHSDVGIIQPAKLLSGLLNCAVDLGVDLCLKPGLTH